MELEASRKAAKAESGQCVILCVDSGGGKRVVAGSGFGSALARSAMYRDFESRALFEKGVI